MNVDAGVEFERYRSRLFNLAYRLLGSAEEAEDVVHDAFLRWGTAWRDGIHAPSAWLAKVVTNLCLSRLASARVRREQHIGPWLPEPVLTADGALGPLEAAEQRDMVSLGMMVLLERLTPAERAVFVLREAFAYSHREIAEILALSEAHSRQLHRRASKRVEHGRPRFQPDLRHRRLLVERFLAAAEDGDVQGLERLFSEDVTSWADSGGRVSAARRPVTGANPVARYLIGAFATGSSRFSGGIRNTVAEVNGQPAGLSWAAGGLIGLIAPEFAGDRISALRIVADPSKLEFLAGQVAQLSHPEEVTGSSYG